MANTAQAKKRAKQADKRNLHNASRRSTMRTSIKKVRKSVAEGKRTEAIAEYPLAASMVDRLAQNGLIHKNKAARLKSRLNASIKKIA